jgi:3-isopropylmalate/(R)-2-methylmalate dehydratase small subunit
MPRMHALHKILANCARPQRKRVQPGAFLEVEPDVFGVKARPGDFIVAGTNFGCGSSTPAHYSIAALGIPAVIAESFGALFFSNCAGGGLWPIVCPGVLDLADAGDTLEVDITRFVVRNVGSGKTLQAQPLPEIYRAMIEAGGEKPYLKARLAKERQAVSSKS